MQIEKITIENFRQFVGKQEILFPKEDAKRNVTLVIGENGSGKRLGKSFSVNSCTKSRFFHLPIG